MASAAAEKRTVGAKHLSAQSGADDAKRSASVRMQLSRSSASRKPSRKPLPMAGEVLPGGVETEVANTGLAGKGTCGGGGCGAAGASRTEVADQDTSVGVVACGGAGTMEGMLGVFSNGARWRSRSRGAESA